MLKRSLIALSMLALPLTVSANWLAGGGYAKISDDIDGDKASVGIVYGSIAYEHKLTDSRWSIMPELILGTGISDGDIEGDKVKADRFIALSARGQYNYKNGVYLFAQPMYANLKVTADFGGREVTNDEWELGLGAGVGKKLNEKTIVEASYNNFDGTDVLTLGIKYSF